MQIIIKTSKIQFKNPQVGLPTKNIQEHYNGRTITALVDGVEEIFRFTKEQLPYICSELEMQTAIENYIIAKQTQENL